jgi:site-specific DNA-adenine methylase
MMPMLKLYGGKYKLAARLTPPQRDLVIECFAGGAGFSTWHEPKKVILVEKDPIIASIWDYLIHVKASEVMRIPTNIMSIEELPARTPEPAKHLVGFFI